MIGILLTISCAKSQDIFKFADQQVNYDNTVRIHLLGHSIVSDKYIVNEGSVFPSLLRASETEMVKLLQILSNTPKLKWEPMTAASPYPPDEIQILIYGPSHYGFMCSSGKGGRAINLLRTIIEPLTGETRKVMEQAIQSITQKNNESK